MSESEKNIIVPRLEPKHLYEKRIQRDASRLKAYNQILSAIQNRIYHVSQLSESANYIMYTVPPFVLGLPAIDMEDCIVYVVYMLRQNGFVVKYTYPNLLYISWKHYEMEYNKEHNPITQAMKPPSSTSKKGKEGKRGNETTSGVTFATVPSILGPSQAPSRSTLDYTPPDVFIQGITRPAPQRPVGNVLPASSQPGQSETTSNVIADLWKFV